MAAHFALLQGCAVGVPDWVMGKSRIVTISGGVCAGLIAFAFVAAPKSCDGGLSAYFWIGVITLLALFAFPVATSKTGSIFERVAVGLAMALLGILAWVAGFAAAEGSHYTSSVLEKCWALGLKSRCVT